MLLPLLAYTTNRIEVFHHWMGYKAQMEEGFECSQQQEQICYPSPCSPLTKQQSDPVFHLFVYSCCHRASREGPLLCASSQTE